MPSLCLIAAKLKLPWGWALWFFAATAIALHAQQLPPAQADAVLKRVDTLYNHVPSLRARYTEQYTGMGMTRTEAGTLTLKKPGRMLWRYDVPAGKLFVFDGRFAWFYTPGDPQAERIPAKQLDALHTPLRFLLGHTDLKRELDGVVVIQQEDQYRIAGTPHEMGNRIRLLTLDVSATGVIRSMKLEEADGAVTLFQFAGVVLGAPVWDSEFAFTPPPGVAVVEGTSPI